MTGRYVGTVRFNARMDGDKLPRDAQKVGMQAGRKGAKGFGDEWDKEFRKGLTAQGKRALTHWKTRGKTDGLTYGRGLELEITKFADRLNRAFDNFQGIQVNSEWLDEFGARSRNVERDLEKLRGEMDLLHRQGGITDAQFRSVSDTIERWSRTQREARLETELTRRQEEQRVESVRQLQRQLAQMDDIEAALARTQEQRRQESIAGLQQELAQHQRARQNLIAVEREHQRSLMDLDRQWVSMEGSGDRTLRILREMTEGTGKLDFQWQNLSHNTRQWTLIIGAVTAALPELAGLSSAAGSGLLLLGGAAAGAGVGIGATISSIVRLNGDIDKLSPALREARSGFDDFKSSFSDLNEVISERAFAGTEQAWRSLGGTVRALSPAFAEVGDSVGDLLNGLAVNIAPGTRAFRNLEAAVRNSAPVFNDLGRTAGKLGGALLEAFANPEFQRSLDETTEYLDILITRFDDFTRSDNFDQWIRNGRAVFGEFGELLDTAGRLLNDLVTPESINRLTTFMDNLGTFLNTGGRGILEFADELNIFGILASTLADFGEQLEPLREPMVALGAALESAIIPAIDGATQAIGFAAEAAVPLIEGLTGILNAVPPGGYEVIGAGLTSIAIAFGLLRAGQGFAGIVNGMRGIQTEGGKAVTALGRVGNAAALVGMGVTGLIALQAGVEGLVEDLREYDKNTQDVLANGMSLAESWDLLGGSALGAQLNMKEMSSSLDQVHQIGGRLDQFFPSFGALFTEAGRQAGGLAEVLTTLSPAMANLAQNDVTAAAEQFSAWATELGATDQQMLNMLDTMPEYRAVLEGIAIQQDGVATNQDILNLALNTGKSAVAGNTSELGLMAEAAGLTQAEVDELASAIRGFGSEALSARDADRQFQQALDDLTASVLANGTSLDIGTQAGRDNEAAIDGVAQAAIEAAAAKVQLTDDENTARAAILEGRNALIAQLEQFGIVGEEAGAYADKLGLIPEDIDTFMQAHTRDAQNAVDNFVSSNNGRRISIIAEMQQGGRNFNGLGQIRQASGGIHHSAQSVLMAESGAEAIVPLQRALSAVDPSVRALSAIAQGKATPAMLGGDSGARRVTFEPGAIVVQDRSGDARRTAVEVMERIFEGLGD